MIAPTAGADEALISSIKVVDYDKETGEILRTVTFPDPIVATTLYPGCVYLDSDVDTSDVRRYVDLDTRTVIDRPAQRLTLDGMALKGVRAGAELVLEEVVYECDGSDIELEFSHPGTYTITVKDWPYLDWSAEIENPA